MKFLPLIAVLLAVPGALVAIGELSGSSEEKASTASSSALDAVTPPPDPDPNPNPNPDPDPNPTPTPQKVSTLAKLFDQEGTDADVNAGFGNSDVGTAYIGSTKYPSSLQYEVFANDNQGTSEFAVPLNGEYEVLKGIFGINRTKNQCSAAEAQLTIEDDAGHVIWPLGSSPTATVDKPVPFRATVKGVGKVKFIPLATMPEGTCTNNDAAIAFGDTKFIGPG